MAPVWIPKEEAHHLIEIVKHNSFNKLVSDYKKNGQSKFVYYYIVNLRQNSNSPSSMKFVLFMFVIYYLLLKLI